MWIEAWDKSPTLDVLSHHRESNEEQAMYKIQNNMNNTLNQHGISYYIEISDNYKIHLNWITNGKKAEIDVHWPIEGLEEANAYIQKFIGWLNEYYIDPSKFIGSNAEEIASNLQIDIEEKIKYLLSK